MATPFYVGELILPALVRRRSPDSAGALVSIWLLERSADATAILLLLLMARAEWGWASALMLA